MGIGSSIPCPGVIGRSLFSREGIGVSRVDGIVTRVLNNVVVWLQNLVYCGELN